LSGLCIRVQNGTVLQHLLQAINIHW